MNLKIFKRSSIENIFLGFVIEIKNDIDLIYYS